MSALGTPGDPPAVLGDHPAVHKGPHAISADASGILCGPLAAPMATRAAQAWETQAIQHPYPAPHKNLDGTLGALGAPGEPPAVL